MKKIWILAPVLGAILYLTLSSHSTGLSTDYTGATGTTGCSCHGGSATTSITVTVELDSSGVSVSHYIPGGSYTIKIKGTNTSSTSLPDFGFQLTAVSPTSAGTSSATNLGTLATSGLPSGCQNSTLGSFHIVQHSTRLSATSGSGGSGTTYVRSIPWTAPAIGSGSVVLYGIINAVNGDGGSSGDHWNSASTVTITELNTVKAITGSATICVGSTSTYHDSTSGGTWSSSSAAVASIGSTTGVVTGASAGTATLTYTVGVDKVYLPITVNGAPSTPASIVGPGSVCTGFSATLTDSTTGGAWWTSNGSLWDSAGIITGITAGMDTITYTVSNTCGSAHTTRIITINLSPSVGTITGSPIGCIGSPVTFYDTTTGGSWSSSDTTVATINSSGVVNPVHSGTAYFYYSIASSCGTVSAYSALFTVSSIPSAGVITGLNHVCAGDSLHLLDSVPGGVWSSGNPLVATIDTGGYLLGLTGGTDYVTYSVTNYCGTGSATYGPITINPAPNPGAISGSSTGICVGSASTFSDSVAGGVWSVSNSHASVDSIGLVSGLSNGTDTLFYTTTNSCGTASTHAVLSIFTTPNAGTIIGPTHVCVGSRYTLSDAVTGGTYSTATGKANIISPGVVEGVMTGLDTVIYTLVTACGTATATMPVTVNAAPMPVSGTASICLGDSVLYTDTLTGTWSSSNTAVALVRSGGEVVSVSPGTALISFTNSAGCSATQSVNVIIPAYLPPVYGPNVVCTGSHISVGDSIHGGVWSASNSHASITSGGMITGLSADVDTIHYTFTNMCGTTVANYPITVNAGSTSTGAITGLSAVCVGSTISLTDTVTGGFWSTTNGNAYVDTSGIVVGNYPGTDTILYGITNSCGITYASKVITISPVPGPGYITGPDSVCLGSNITLMDSVAGGTWSVSNGRATISLAGVLHGTMAGGDTVYYSLSGSCGTFSAMRVIGIDNNPYAGPITGPSVLCVGSSGTISDSVYSGFFNPGTWPVLSDSNVSIIGLSGYHGALVTGRYPGIDTLSLTVSDACGSITVTKVFSVNATTVTASLAGPAEVCVGTSITITDSLSSGDSFSVVSSFSNSNASVAGLVGLGDRVTGVHTGIDTLSVNISNGCGSINLTKIITVSPVPVAGVISGPDSVCLGSNITLMDSVAGGIWSVSNSKATISSSGVLHGTMAGGDTVYYSLSGSCGTISAMQVIGIDNNPYAGPITGPSVLCVGSSGTVTDSVYGGYFHSASWPMVSDSNVSITDLSGYPRALVTGRHPGTDTVSLTVSNACGSITVTKVFTVNAATVTASLTGATEVCAGASITITDSISSSDSFSVFQSFSNTDATVTGLAGVGERVTGVSAGIDTLSVNIANSCGSINLTKIITVNPVPVAGVISGTTNVCPGTMITLSDTASGGVWSSSGTTTVLVTGGVVTGISAGTDTIKYTVTNMCGSAVAYQTITVNELPSAGILIGVDSICVGTAEVITSTSTGGIWMFSNGHASISGDTIAGVSTGTDTLLYTVTNVCGTVSVSMAVSVRDRPALSGITGMDTVCVGASTTLADSLMGGSWFASNTDATDSGGIVRGVAAGLDTIFYMASNFCGSDSVRKIIHIEAVPAAGMIYGADSVCQSLSINLVDSGGSTGIWSCTNGRATVTGGIVLGVSGGLDTVLYRVSNTCGSHVANHTIYVNVVPVIDSIIGPDSVCRGTVAHYSDSSVGNWYVTNSRATISTGALLGVSVGLDTIIYTDSNACGIAWKLKPVWIDTLVVPTVTGASYLCIGNPDTFAAVPVGGSWSFTNANAIVSGDIATGSVSGMDTLIYRYTNICGTGSDSVSLRIFTIHQCDSVLLVGGESSIESINIYPNPGRGIYTIALPASSQQAELVVSDMYGRNMLHWTEANQQEIKLDLSNVANGTYMVTVNAGGQRYRMKVVKW